MYTDKNDFHRNFGTQMKREFMHHALLTLSMHTYIYNFTEKSTEITKMHHQDWIKDTRSKIYLK